MKLIGGERNFGKKELAKERYNEIMEQAIEAVKIYRRYTGYNPDTIVMNSNTHRLITYASELLTGYGGQYVCGMKIMIDDAASDGIVYVVQNKMRYPVSEGEEE